MSDISFYHLTATPLERALPRLLEKVLDSGARAVVLGASEPRIESLDTAFWVYDPDSFLPHGTAGAGKPEDQPIYLTTLEENPNDATILVLVDGVDPAFVNSFSRCLDIFDGTDEAAVAAARERWSARKSARHTVTYWKQAANGRWEKAA
jgi:DNA polymerase-3 subunit chi